MAAMTSALAVHELSAGVVEVPQHVRDAYVSPRALDLIQKGVPENTWLAYRRQLIMFGDWCANERRTAAPVTEATMLEYLAFMADLPMPGTMSRLDEEGKRRRFRPAPSSTWIWYSAVRFIHGMGTPPIPWEPAKKLSSALEGYEREMRELGWAPRSAPRAYPDDVRRMVLTCDRDTPNGIRDAAILLNGWNTAARAADLSSYRIRDVRATPKGIDFHLTRSKTLKPGQTRHMAVFHHRDLEGYKPEFDPVLAWSEWVQWLGGAGGSDPRWPLFRPLGRWGVISEKHSRPDYFLSAVSVADVVTKAALLAGLDETYTMHSLRRGYATWLRELGHDPLSIARAYGWAPGGSINTYLEEADRWAETAPGSGAIL